MEGFRKGEVGAWIEYSAVAAARACQVAEDYLEAVRDLSSRWRARLNEVVAPRSDAAAWAVLEVLPGHPVLTGPAAAAVTGRSKAAIYQAIDQLVAAGVLEPLSTSRRNRSWEATGLLDLLERLDSKLPLRS